jgi:tRNA dimethylallyltransferase
MKPIIIYGPTSTGKTSLSLELANKLNGQILSADSRQVYKRLDIGSGKVSLDSKAVKNDGYWIVDGIKIYGFDVCPPGENFTVADYINESKIFLENIRTEKKVTLIVGGTGLYINLLLNGLDSYGVPVNNQLRKSLEGLSVEKLSARLKKIDPQKLASLNQSDRRNPRRLIRAIELSSSTVRERGLKPLLTNPNIVGLTARNEFLYKRSDAWLKKRLENGLLGEINGLLKSGVSPKWLEDLGLEYRWLTQYLTGKLSYDQAINGLMGDTHDFIRRQKTWFSKFKGITLYDIEDKNYKKQIGKDLWF